MGISNPRTRTVLLAFQVTLADVLYILVRFCTCLYICVRFCTLLAFLVNISDRERRALIGKDVIRTEPTRLTEDEITRLSVLLTTYAGKGLKLR